MGDAVPVGDALVAGIEQRHDVVIGEQHPVHRLDRRHLLVAVGCEDDHLDQRVDRGIGDAGIIARTRPVGGGRSPEFGLLKEAGWALKGNRMVNEKTGQPLSIEILLGSQSFERTVLPFANNLKKIGIEARLRTVDASQYTNRVRSFDYDMIYQVWAETLNPGNEQAEFWGSAAADKTGSRNTIGIKNPAVDKLIDKIVFAKDRADLVAATHALDRVLLWNFYVVPQWYYPYERIAYWDIFGRPQTLPSQSASLLQVWWLDADKQKAVATARAK